MLHITNMICSKGLSIFHCFVTEWHLGFLCAVHYKTSAAGAAVMFTCHVGRANTSLLDVFYKLVFSVLHILPTHRRCVWISFLRMDIKSNGDSQLHKNIFLIEIRDKNFFSLCNIILYNLFVWVSTQAPIKFHIWSLHRKPIHRPIPNIPHLYSGEKVLGENS